MRAPRNKHMTRYWALAVGLGIFTSTSVFAAQELLIGSKRFTESYILAEILTQTAAQSTAAIHRPGLGNTAILYEALKNGAIDLYPEYLGTIELEILKRPTATLSIDQVNRELAPAGLAVAIPFGFNNTYALAVRSKMATRLHLVSIDDLAAHPELRIGTSHEFLGRNDGWPGLARTYSLPQKPIGLDHGIAYEALAKGQIDVIDAYSTDAKIQKYGLTVLRDDKHYFPRYDALVMYRRDIPQRFPKAWSDLMRLAGHIDERRMIAMNSSVELDHQTFAAVAHAFLTGATTLAAHKTGLWDKLAGNDFWRLTFEHVRLVVLAVLAASLLGVPLGVAAFSLRRVRAIVMMIVATLQTIPALALLAFFIPLFGRIGTIPALAALFVYSLLPIVRNTLTGLSGVSTGLREAARALGLGWWDRMKSIELPLAGPLILAGIRIAAVISVGTATIAAFIGAGGYGQRITVGLALNDNDMLLAGAIPAAALAVAVEALFSAVEYGWGRRNRTIS